MTHPDTQKMIQLVEVQTCYRVTRMHGEAQRMTIYPSPIPALISE